MKQAVNIIGCGPSSVDVTEEDLLPDALNIVVNHAVGGVGERIRVDVWSFMDPPGGGPLGPLESSIIWELVRGLQPETAIWVGTQRDAWIPYRVEDRLVEKSRLLMALDGDMDPEHTERTYLRIMPTVPWLIALTAKDGAKRIRLLGCDMMGSGDVYRAHMLPFTEEETEADTARWKLERGTVHAVAHQYAKLGVSVERALPERV